MATSVQIVIDCADPDRLARFWAEALGYQLQPPPEGYGSWQDFLTAIGVPPEDWNSASAVVDPAGAGPRLFFQRVPEPKQVKNRLHLDLNVGGGHSVPLDERKTRVGAEARRLESLGATLVGTKEQRGEYWATLLDPEGNEFDLQ